MSDITPVKMPKWGLAMEEGRIVEWFAAEGDEVALGQDLVDIETSKITNVCEAPGGGVLRRIVAEADETLPVGALIAVMADPAVPDAEINAFIERFQADFDPAEAANEASGPEIRTVDAGGRRLRVGVAGEGLDGVPVVFLHGFGGDLNNWMLVQTPLGEARPTYAIELPGHGQSSKDIGGGGLADLAAAVVAAIEALGLERVALVGHSLGGAVAVETAARLGARAASLALICPAGLPGGTINAQYLDDFVAARRARDLRGPVAQLFADPDMATRDMLEDLIKAKRLDGAQEALTAIKGALKGGDPAFGALAERLAALDAPILILASREDRIVGAPDVSALPASAELRFIDGAGHMPHLERSGEVADALRGFL